MADEQVPRKIYCVRNGCMKVANEHMGCPYCFGRKREVVEEGEHKDFCDFDPDKDPISFGFPQDCSRSSRG